MNKKEIYEEAINIFGEESQTLKFLEEMGECQAALCRLFNNEESEKLQLAALEEMVDVLIMAEQMEIICGEEFQEMKKKKLDRLANRLGERYETI